MIEILKNWSFNKQIEAIISMYVSDIICTERKVLNSKPESKIYAKIFSLVCRRGNVNHCGTSLEL